jgi:general secretion pathway protein F
MKSLELQGSGRVPEYSYRAFDGTGEIKSGRLDAASFANASSTLHRQGLTAIDIHEGNPSLWMRLNEPFSIFTSIKDKDVCAFYRDLSRLLSAGMSIDDALDLLSDMHEKSDLYTHTVNIRERVRKGASLSSAMSDEEDIFPVHILASINASENSGTLPETLADAAANLERSLEFRSKLKSALIYPTILLMMVCATVAMVVLFVIPQFEPLFEGKEDRLPGLTQFVMSLGKFSADNWQIISTFVALALASLLLVFTHRDIRSRLLGQICKVSRFAYWIQTPDFMRFTRTLAVSLKNGVALDKALKMSVSAVTQAHIAKDLQIVTDDVRAGKALSVCFGRIVWMPTVLSHFTKVGEHSGRLGQMIEEASDILSREYEEKLERLLKIISPLLTLIMGALVAMLVGSVLLGIMSISDVAL